MSKTKILKTPIIITLTFCLFFTFSFLAGCAKREEVVLEPEEELEEEAALTPTQVSSGETIIVTSTADSGPGTLRQALLDAQSGDTITFAPAVFPPSAPATIYLLSNLPNVERGHLTIDASEAGVILDGSKLLSSPAYGLQILSDRNTVKGLQIINFSEGGIAISEAHYNTIGGDRNTGSGPIGQGNMISGNNVGVGLWGRASFNIITGNLIGTDSDGVDALGNSMGITISEGANRNTVGPNNVIAYNGENGIDIRDSSSIGNTITLNNIYANNWMGIELDHGGNTELAAPFIFDFDLGAGTVTGDTYANYTVEIFSDSSNEGEIYEGQTAADGVGFFTFNKGKSFIGPCLTATATSADGNTSPFSVPTSGTSRLLILQQENDLPKAKLQSKQSKELLDNNIGNFVSLKRPDETLPEDYVNWINNFGYKWDFLTIDWFDFTEVLESGEYSEFTITSEQDKIITGLVDNGINVIYCLVYYEPIEIDIPFSFENLEAYLVKDPDKEGRFRTEGEIQRYLDYVRFIVSHFKDRIKYYQILNEPLNGIRGQYVKSEDYINLVERVIPVIRDECPDAKIIVGSVFGLPDEPGCIPSEPTCYEYLFNILNSDIMPLVDGISFHPSPELSPEHGGDSYYKYYQQTIQEIKDVATFNGFRGEFITEGPTFACQARPPQTYYYSDIIAAKYNSRSVIMHLNKNFIVILPLGEGLLKVRATKNLCTIMAGAKPVSLPIGIESEATNITSYSFSLSNGDTLIALWTDGIAVDEDPGIKADLTLKNFTAQDVVGIDVLRGYYQTIITSSENGNLIIQNLIVRDYPLILHITKSSTQN
jgi:hypothetical protein